MKPSRVSVCWVSSLTHSLVRSFFFMNSLPIFWWGKKSIQQSIYCYSNKAEWVKEEEEEEEERREKNKQRNDHFIASAWLYLTAPLLMIRRTSFYFIIHVFNAHTHQQASWRQLPTTLGFIHNSSEKKMNVVHVCVNSLWLIEWSNYLFYICAFFSLF